MKRILIIDDEEIIRKSLQMSLNSVGYCAIAVADAEQAVAVEQEQSFEVAIVDWMLKSSMHGMDLVERLRSSNPEIAVIFVTGLFSESISDLVDSLPSSRLLHKPVRLRQLVDAIESLEVAQP